MVNPTAAWPFFGEFVNQRSIAFRYELDAGVKCQVPPPPALRGPAIS